jgi:Family of unknown function (DUF6368)
LASFILELYKIFGGFIDFNGKISPPLVLNKNGKFVEETYEEALNYVKRIEGKIHEISYEIETDGRTSYYHICDALWLSNWLQHVDFHLIK